MAYRKNTKRIDPRYFLDETVNRGEDLEEGWGFRDDEKDKPYLGKYAGGGEGLPTEQTPEEPWGTSAEETFFGNGGTGDVRDKDPHSQSQIRGKRAAEQDRISMLRTAKALRAQGKDKKADFLVAAWNEREELRRSRGGLAESETGSSGHGKELKEERSIFAPNHYCVHHGGVRHEGKIKMAETINHNFDRELNKVTHYDMRLQDGTILEGVAAEDIQVVRASLAEEHSHEGGCPSEEGGEAIDISAPGTEVHGDDISQLSPEEAFTAGLAAARDAIDQAMGGPVGPPPDELEEIVSDEDMKKAGLQSAGWEPEGGEEALAKRSAALEKADLQTGGWEPEGGEEALAWRDKLRGKK
jgi:hypothetical protein